MNPSTPVAVSIFTGYLLAFLAGSIPFGLLIARLFHVRDLTARGSGNIGATNVSRIVGFWPAGLLTLALDLAKGAFCILAARLPSVQEGWLRSSSPATPAMIWAVGAAAVVGHCFSPWLKLRGGKGVATGLGVLLVLAPGSALVGLLTFALVFFESRVGSLSSISGLILTAVAYLIFNPPGDQLWFGALILGVILLRHRSNLDALLEDRESGFSKLKP